MAGFFRKLTYSTLIAIELFIFLFFIQISLPVTLSLNKLFLINLIVFLLILILVITILKKIKIKESERINKYLGKICYVFLPFLAVIFLFPEYLIGEKPPLIITLIIFSLIIIFFLMNLYFLKIQRIFSKNNYQFLILSIVCSFYFLLILGINIFKYYNFSFVGRDLTVFIQSLWTTINCKGFFANTMEGGSHFGLHNSPILFFFVPFYYLFPHPVILFLIKCLIISLTPIPFYLIMKNHTGKTQSLILALGILFIYQVFFQATWEFYPVQLFPLFFLFSFYYSEKNKFCKYLFFLLLILFLREDLFLITTGLSVYFLLTKKKIKWIAWTFIIGFLWYFLSVFFVFPIYGNLYEAVFSSHYQNKTLTDIITHPKQIINALLINKKEKFYLIYLLLKQNGLFLIFFSKVFVIASFLLMALLFTPSKYLVLHLAQYSLPLGVIFYLSASLGIIKIFKIHDFFKLNKEIFSTGLSSFLLLTVLLSFSVDIFHPLLKGELTKPYYASSSDYDRNRRHYIKDALSIVPENVSVCAPRYFLPMLGNREKIYLLIENLKDEDFPDYIILNNEDNNDEVTKKYHKINHKRIYESGFYKEIYNKEGIIVFKKTDDIRPRQYHKHSH